jgi:hypothetical protein
MFEKRPNPDSCTAEVSISIRSPDQHGRLTAMSDFLPLATDLRTSREARFVLIHAASTAPMLKFVKLRKRGPPNSARTGRKPPNHWPKLKRRHPVARLHADAGGDGDTFRSVVLTGARIALAIRHRARLRNGSGMSEVPPMP